MIAHCSVLFSGPRWGPMVSSIPPLMDLGRMAALTGITVGSRVPYIIAD